MKFITLKELETLLETSADNIILICTKQDYFEIRDNLFFKFSFNKLKDENRLPQNFVLTLNPTFKYCTWDTDFITANYQYIGSDTSDITLKEIIDHVSSSTNIVKVWCTKEQCKIIREELSNNHGFTNWKCDYDIKYLVLYINPNPNRKSFSWNQFYTNYNYKFVEEKVKNNDMKADNKITNHRELYTALLNGKVVLSLDTQEELFMDEEGIVRSGKNKLPAAMGNFIIKTFPDWHYKLPLLCKIKGYSEGIYVIIEKYDAKDDVYISGNYSRYKAKDIICIDDAEFSEKYLMSKK